MAAACGAAEEAPQKIENPGVVVRTQVAAVMSGFWISFSAGGGEIARRDGGAVGLEEDPPRPVRVVAADRLGAVEDTAGPPGALDGDGRHSNGVFGRRVSEELAGGRDCQLPFQGVQTQVSVRRSGYLDDDQAVAGVVVTTRGDVLVRVPGAVLDAGRTPHDIAVLVDHEQVVVVGRAFQRVGPPENKTARAVRGDPVLGHAASEVVLSPDRDAVEDQRASRGEIALPDSGGAVVLVAGSFPPPRRRSSRRPLRR